MTDDEPTGPSEDELPDNPPPLEDLEPFELDPAEFDEAEQFVLDSLGQDGFIARNAEVIDCVEQ